MSGSSKISGKHVAMLLSALFAISAVTILIGSSEDVTAADTEYEVGPWTYTVNSDGDAVITKWYWLSKPNEVVDGKLAIPEKIKAEEDTIERTVVEIRGPAITTPGSMPTFYPADAGVKEIILPDSLKNVSHYAFQGCTTLETIDISNVTSIGLYAFRNCASLVNLTMPTSVFTSSNSFIGCSSLVTIDLTNMSANGMVDFRDCTALKNVTLPTGGFTLPATYAFQNCSSLEEIDLTYAPRVVYSMFADCTALKKVIMPEKEGYEMYASAFSGCTSLEKIDLRNVGTISFLGTTVGAGLKEYAVSDSNALYAAVDGLLVNKSKDTVVMFPYSHPDRDDYKVPNGIKTIGAFAFMDVPIKKIDLNEVTAIESAAFRWCYDLVSFDAPNLKSIAEYAFHNCSSIIVADVSSVENAESRAFGGCTAIETVVVPDKMDIGDMFINCNNIKKYLVSDSSDYASDNGILYTKDMETMVRVPPAWDTENFIVPEGVKTLKEKVFKNYAKLVTVDISDVTEMGYEAFSGCTSLVSVDISQFVIVGDRTFYNCTSLEYIDLAMITYVGDQAFYNCAKLQSLDMVEVEHIGNEAFYGCHNFTMAIAPKAGYVEDYAFSKCDGLLVASFPEAEYVGQLRDCKSLRSLDVSGATFVGGAMICMALNDVKLPETPYTLGGFERCGFKILDLKGATKVIGRAGAVITFSGCADLTYFSAPNVTSMVGGFDGCPKLAYVYMPMLQDINYSSYQMFKDCTLLEIVYLPKLNITAGDSTGSMFEGASVNRLVVSGIISTALSGKGLVLSNLFFTSDYKSGLIPSNISPSTKIYRSPDATGWNESYGIFHTIGFYVGESKVLGDVIADNGRIREPFILEGDRIWILDGEAFDFNQRITSDLILRDGAAPVHIDDGDGGDDGGNTGIMLAAIGSVIAIIVVAVIFLLRRPA